LPSTASIAAGRVTGIRNDSSIQLQPLPLERIDAPTLVMTARDDLFDTVPAAEYLAEHIPGARLVVFDSGGHLFVGRQTEVKDIIADFLAGIASTDTGAHPLKDWARSA
jgi:2-hydroxy-6-oxonona-2,4-dienedioate hydrolase